MDLIKNYEIITLGRENTEDGTDQKSSTLNVRNRNRDLGKWQKKVEKQISLFLRKKTGKWGEMR